MKPYLNNVTGKSTSDVITLQGGLNTCYDKAHIEDNQLPYSINVAPLKSPTLSTRSNRLSLAWRMQDTNTYALGKVLGLFSSSSNTLYEIEYHSAEENHLYKYTYSDGYLVKEYVGTLESANYYSICECRDNSNIYIVISNDGGKYIYTEGRCFRSSAR